MRRAKPTWLWKRCLRAPAGRVSRARRADEARPRAAPGAFRPSVESRAAVPQNRAARSPRLLLQAEKAIGGKRRRPRSLAPRGGARRPTFPPFSTSSKAFCANRLSRRGFAHSRLSTRSPWRTPEPRSASMPLRARHKAPKAPVLRRAAEGAFGRRRPPARLRRLGRIYRLAAQDGEPLGAPPIAQIRPSITMR